MGSPLALWLGELPFFGNMGIKHHGAIISFLLIPMAALGAKIISEGRTRAYQPLIIFVIMTTIMSLILAWYGLGKAIPSFLTGSLKYRLPVLLLALYLILSSPERERQVYSMIILAVTEMSIYLPLGLPLGYPTPVMGIIQALGALAAVSHSRKKTAITGITGAIAVSIFSLMVFLPGKGLPERQSVASPPPHQAWLNEHKSPLYRTFGIPPSYSSIYGIQDFGTTQPIVPREFDFFVNAVGGPPTDFYGPLWMHLFGYRGGKREGYPLGNYIRYKRAWDFMGLKYFVVNKHTCAKYPSECGSLASNSLTRVYEDDTAAVFESKSALPKAFAVTSWEGAASEDAARQYVIKNIESLTDIPPIIEGIEGRHGAPGNTPVEITDFGSNRVEVKSNLNSPHIIVLTDNFDNGWTAYVDNKKTAIFRANATVRSVYVPEGGHTIVLIYRPWAFVLPLVPAALAFLYISFLLFINKGKSAEV